MRHASRRVEGQLTPHLNQRSNDAQQHDKHRWHQDFRSGALGSAQLQLEILADKKSQVPKLTATRHF